MTHITFSPRPALSLVRSAWQDKFKPSAKLLTDAVIDKIKSVETDLTGKVELTAFGSDKKDGSVFILAKGFSKSNGKELEVSYLLDSNGMLTKGHRDADEKPFEDQLSTFRAKQNESQLAVLESELQKLRDNRKNSIEELRSRGKVYDKNGYETEATSQYNMARSELNKAIKKIKADLARKVPEPDTRTITLP